MLDLTSIKSRYFDVKFNVEDNKGNVKTVSIQLKPPKLKLMQQRNNGENQLELLQTILNNNRSGYVVSKEIIENMDIDTIKLIISKYFDWISNVKNSSKN